MPNSSCCSLPHHSQPLPLPSVPSEEGKKHRERVSKIVEKHRPNLSPYESLYKHFHKNPELSWMEKETSETIRSRLAKLGGYKIVANIGGYGLVGILRNGDGPTVMLRADMDALPIKENTGLPYASNKRMRDESGSEEPVMHACGHDFHITALLGAAELLFSSQSQWSGTAVVLFQPAEEKDGGAQAMVDDGLYEEDKHNVPIPDIVLGAHVGPFKSGTLLSHPQVFLISSDSIEVTLYGKGAHGSQPHLSIDPIVMAASIITRLQSVISRELSLFEQAVLTVGSIKGGYADNIIPSEVELKVNVRAIEQKVRKKVLDAVERIIRAEARSSGAKKDPKIVLRSSYPVTYNDEDLTIGVGKAFSTHFGDDKYYDLGEPLQGSEDFSILARAVDKPSCYWCYGGIDPDLWEKKKKEDTLDDIPANHSEYFAPAIQPTLKTGLDSYAVAALTYLAEK